MNGPDREPLHIDTGVAHAARVWDFLLGGTDNFEVDRKLAVEAHAHLPGGLDDARAIVRANRQFLGRTVRHLAGEMGVRQFLDVGTGIPNATSAHAVARATAPDCRVVCVDRDPIVLAHAHSLVASTPEGAAAFVHGDLRAPDDILAAASATLELDQPVGVLLVAILHFVTEAEDPYGIVARLMDAVCPGSYLVISHGAADIDPGNMAQLAKRLSDGSWESLVWRSRRDVSLFFGDLDLVEPGVVPVNEWRPDGTTSDAGRIVPVYGGIGRKRRPAGRTGPASAPTPRDRSGTEAP